MDSPTCPALGPDDPSVHELSHFRLVQASSHLALENLTTATGGPVVFQSSATVMFDNDPLGNKSHVIMLIFKGKRN